MWDHIMLVDFEEANWKLYLSRKNKKATFYIKYKSNSNYMFHLELFILILYIYIYDCLFIKLNTTRHI